MSSKRKKARDLVSYGDHHPNAVFALIVERWLDHSDLTNDEIASALNLEYGLKINADTVKAAAKKARRDGLLRFTPSKTDELERKVAKAAGLPANAWVHVLNSDSACHTAEKIAEFMFAHIRDTAADREVVHIGFFGGRTNSFVAQKFVAILDREAAGLGGKSPPPAGRRLVLHSLVGALQSADPETDPNTFSSYFIQRHAAVELVLGRRLEFVKLPLPGLVTNDGFDTLRRLPGVSELFDQRPEFDLILASCGHIGHRYTLTDYVRSGLRTCPRLAELFRDMSARLNDLEVIGDIAWHPIHPDGRAVELDMLPLRVATLFTLPELREVVKKSTKTRVILAVGPCSDDDCAESKAALLRCALETKPLLAHHIFTNRHTAEDYLEGG